MAAAPREAMVIFAGQFLACLYSKLGDVGVRQGRTGVFIDRGTAVPDTAGSVFEKKKNGPCDAARKGCAACMLPGPSASFIISGRPYIYSVVSRRKPLDDAAHASAVFGDCLPCYRAETRVLFS